MFDPPAVRRYRVPCGCARAQLVVKNSLFIGAAGRASSAEEALTFLEAERLAHPGASHYAWAYLGAGGASAQRNFSDDGEPGGTAGRPMLAVLEGSGVWDVVVVGTRYYGGINLGPGGLVRAYGKVARQALAELPTTERALYYTATISVDYSLYAHLRRLLPQYQGRILGERFGDSVSLEVAVPAEQGDMVAALLADLSSGTVDLTGGWQGWRYLDT